MSNTPDASRHTLPEGADAGMYVPTDRRQTHRTAPQIASISCRLGPPASHSTGSDDSGTQDLPHGRR